MYFPHQIWTHLLFHFIDFLFNFSSHFPVTADVAIYRHTQHSCDLFIHTENCIILFKVNVTKSSSFTTAASTAVSTFGHCRRPFIHLRIFIYEGRFIIVQDDYLRYHNAAAARVDDKNDEEILREKKIVSWPWVA